jgi:hypothetical protein
MFPRAGLSISATVLRLPGSRAEKSNAIDVENMSNAMNHAVIRATKVMMKKVQYVPGSGHGGTLAGTL